jgi:hypothetical protein
VNLKRRGVETRIVLASHNTDENRPNHDPALIKAIARAHKWCDGLIAGCTPSVAAIAAAEGVSDRYVSQLLPLGFLSPDIVETILSGCQPVDMTAEALIKRTDVPLDWAEQTAMFVGA